jgi:hypothetical protein
MSLEKFYHCCIWFISIYNQLQYYKWLSVYCYMCVNSVVKNCVPFPPIFFWFKQWLCPWECIWFREKKDFLNDVKWTRSMTRYWKILNKTEEKVLSITDECLLFSAQHKALWSKDMMHNQQSESQRFASGQLYSPVKPPFVVYIISISIFHRIVLTLLL